MYGSFDVSKGLALLARIGEKGVAVTLVFTKKSDGTPYSLVDKELELPVYLNNGDTDSVFTLTLGDGLTIVGSDGNKLRIKLTKARSERRPEAHFWLLRDTEADYSLLYGPFFFYNGFNSHTMPEEIEVKIDTAGAINTTGLAHIQLAYDASTNLFPDAPLGSGTAGILGKGDMFPVSVGGTLKDQDNEDQDVPAGSILMLIGDPSADGFDPQDGSNWRILS